MIDLIPFCLSILISSGLTLYLTEKPLMIYTEVDECIVAALKLEADLSKKETLIVGVCGCVSVSVALEGGIINQSQLYLLKGI